MARNWVQFQRGLSLPEVHKRYGTEEKYTTRHSSPCAGRKVSCARSVQAARTAITRPATCWPRTNICVTRGHYGVLHLPIAIEATLAIEFRNTKILGGATAASGLRKRPFAQAIGRTRETLKWPLVTQMLVLGR